MYKRRFFPPARKDNVSSNSTKLDKQEKTSKREANSNKSHHKAMQLLEAIDPQISPEYPRLHHSANDSTTQKPTGTVTVPDKESRKSTCAPKEIDVYTFPEEPASLVCLGGAITDGSVVQAKKRGRNQPVDQTHAKKMKLQVLDIARKTHIEFDLLKARRIQLKAKKESESQIRRVQSKRTSGQDKTLIDEGIEKRENLSRNKINLQENDKLAMVKVAPKNNKTTKTDAEKCEPPKKLTRLTRKLIKEMELPNNLDMDGIKDHPNKTNDVKICHTGNMVKPTFGKRMGTSKASASRKSDVAITDIKDGQGAYSSKGDQADWLNSIDGDKYTTKRTFKNVLKKAES